MTPADVADCLVRADTARASWRQRALENRRQYLNLEGKGEDDRLRFNFLHAIIRYVRALLTPRVLEAKAFSESEEATHPDLVQDILNDQARESRLADAVGRAIHHLLLDGNAFLKVSWGAPYTPGAEPDATQAVEVPTPQRDGRHGRVGERDAILRSLWKTFPRWQRVDAPIVCVPDSFDVLVDPDATAGIADARWYAIRSWVYVDDLEERVRLHYYTPGPVTSATGSPLPSSRERWGERALGATNSQVADAAVTEDGIRVWPNLARHGTKATPRRKVEVWEFFDQDAQRIYHWAPGIERLLYDEPMELLADRPWLVDLKVEYDPTSYWVPPDTAQIVELQEDLDASVNAIRDHLRRHAKRPILTRRGVNTEDRTAVAQSKDADLIEVTDPKDFVPLETGSLSADFLGFPKMLQDGMTLAMGVSQMAQGIPTQGSTATEIRAIGQALDIRMDDIRVAVDAAITEVLGLYLALDQQCLPQHLVIQRYGAVGRLWGAQAGTTATVDLGEGADETFDPRGKLRGKYGLELLVGAAGETKQALRLQQTLLWRSQVAMSPNVDTRAVDEETMRVFGKNPERFMAARETMDVDLQSADALVKGVGRSPGESGGAPEAQPDLANRGGLPSEAAQQSQLERGMGGA